MEAVRSCFQTVVWAYERLPITNDSRHYPWLVGKEQIRPCQRVLDGLPCPLVMRVSQCWECGSHAHDPARVMTLTLLVTEMLWLLITFIF